MTRPKLLVSFHDASPLTVSELRDAIEVAATAGVPASCLTILVIPFHDSRTTLSDDAPLCNLLSDLASRGATLVAHGYTHRMTTRGPRTPWGWFATRIFARGQGELATTTADDTRATLDAADAELDRAGIATTGFVAPGWLLSRAAAGVVAERELAFVERFGGIDVGGELRAKRLIGWGALTWVEARATSAFAWIQSHRRAADTRVAIHPPDLRRATTRRSLERTLARLVARLEPVSYATYLGQGSAVPARAQQARS